MEEVVTLPPEENWVYGTSKHETAELHDTYNELVAGEGGCGLAWDGGKDGAATASVRVPASE